MSRALNILLFALVSGFLLITFLPWPWLLRFVAASSFALLTFLRLTPPDDPYGHFPGLGLVLISGAVMMVGALLAVRTLVELYRRRSRPAPRRGRSPLMNWADRALAAAAGGVAALYLFIALGWMAQGFTHGYVLHGVLIAAGLAVAIAALWQAVALLSVFLLGGGLAMAALSTWGATVFPRTVAAAALEAAAGRPFCLGLLERGRKPRTAGDLTFLTMDKSAGGHAALLVQDNSGLIATHWSYHAGSFSDPKRPSRVVRYHVIPCIPGQDLFATTDETDDRAFTILRPPGAFRIPAAYRPKTLNGDTIDVEAEAPDFLPAPGGWWSPGFTVGGAPRIDGEIEYARKDAWTTLNAAAPSSVAPKAGTYLATDGPQKTVIDCDSRNGRTCLHSFSRGDDYFRFRYPIALLPRWREMEDRFTALVASFAAPRPDPAD